MTGYRTIAATTFALIATVFMPEPASSFVLRPPAQISTRLYLEDWVADLIDKELYRQGHREEFEAEWMEKNRAAVLHKVESDFGPLDDLDDSDFRMYQKDKNMAVRDPEKYCADRCIATGNCEVFQDL